MWIQVRSIDGRKSVYIRDLSKLTKIEEIRERLVEHFDAAPNHQRLFYRGKEDGNTLFDYDVGVNDVIQLMAQPIPMPPSVPISSSLHLKSTAVLTSVPQSASDETTNAQYGTAEGVDEEEIGVYKINDKVDARDPRIGAWFEAQVVMVTSEPMHNNAAGSSSSSDETIFYHVKFDDYKEEEVAKLTTVNIRPRACYRLQWDQLVVGNHVMLNYNLDMPKERGFWYDAVIRRKGSRHRALYVNLMLGGGIDSSQEIQVKFIDEIYRIEPGPETAIDRACIAEGATRTNQPDCVHCKDNSRRKCKHCACTVCGGKDSPDKQLLCDECDMAYHLWCLVPSLDSVPDTDDWYCPCCKTNTSEVIGAGESMRLTKKKAKMVSKKRSSERDWGKGMACAGLTKHCTIVPHNHFGTIPGIPVGSMWWYRKQVHECGIHRGSVSGIHGRQAEGAYSIVLSGGYKGDWDKGDEFMYSGSGGRDLKTGNKRTDTKQSCDQKLTSSNRALARNCDCPIDDKKGGVAKNWRNGRVVRVIRNYKACKVSEYAPKEGNRYDGFYKVVKYWPEKEKSGFIVWKYLMRRDDPSPAPWTKEGKEAAEKLGLTMQYPEGCLKENLPGSGKGKGRKRKCSVTDGCTPPPTKHLCSELSKQQKILQLTEGQKTLIDADVANRQLWNKLLESACTVGLLALIQETFTCAICQEIVFQPVTTPCAHNLCKGCIVRSMKAEVHSCPVCRHELGENPAAFSVNKQLQLALLEFYPGYDGGR